MLNFLWHKNRRRRLNLHHSFVAGLSKKRKGSSLTLFSLDDGSFETNKDRFPYSFYNLASSKCRAVAVYIPQRTGRGWWRWDSIIIQLCTCEAIGRGWWDVYQEDLSPRHGATASQHWHCRGFLGMMGMARAARATTEWNSFLATTPLSVAL